MRTSCRLPREKSRRLLEDVTLRPETGDLFLQRCNLGQFRALLAIPGKRRGRCRSRLTHPAPQHALCKIKVPARLSDRNTPLGHQLYCLDLELAAELSSRHIKSPIP